MSRRKGLQDGVSAQNILLNFTPEIDKINGRTPLDVVQIWGTGRKWISKQSPMTIEGNHSLIY
jgi:hypothetical protein